MSSIQSLPTRRTPNTSAMQSPYAPFSNDPCVKVSAMIHLNKSPASPAKALSRFSRQNHTASMVTILQDLASSNSNSSCLILSSFSPPLSNSTSLCFMLLTSAVRCAICCI